MLEVPFMVSVQLVGAGVCRHGLWDDVSVVVKGLGLEVKHAIQ